MIGEAKKLPFTSIIQWLVEETVGAGMADGVVKARENQIRPLVRGLLIDRIRQEPDRASQLKALGDIVTASHEIFEHEDRLLVVEAAIPSLTKMVREMSEEVGDMIAQQALHGHDRVKMEDVRIELRKVNDDFKIKALELAANFDRITAQHERRLDRQEERITWLTGMIGDHEDRLTGVERLAQLHSGNIAMLRSEVGQHAIAIRENARLVDILALRQLHGMSSDDALKAIEPGGLAVRAFHRLDEKAQKKIREQIEDKADREDAQEIVGTFGEIHQYAKIGFDVLTSTGILEGDDAAIAAKAVGVLGSVASGAGTGATVGGGPWGAVVGAGVGLVRGLVNAFGDEPESELETILKALRKMEERIHKRFDRIEEALEQLGTMIAKMHKEMRMSFDFLATLINDSTEEIRRKLVSMHGLIATDTYLDVLECGENIRILEEADSKIDSWQALQKFHPEFVVGLQGLARMTMENGEALFYLENVLGGHSPDARPEVVVACESSYRPLWQLLKSSNGGARSSVPNRQTEACLTLMNVSNTFDDELTFRRGIRQNDRISAQLSAASEAFAHMDSLFDPYFVTYVSDWFLYFMPYFELGGDSRTLSPLPLNQMRKMDADRREFRAAKLRARLERLVSYCNVAVAQQRLLSGATLFQETARLMREGSEDEKEALHDAIAASPYFFVNWEIRKAHSAIQNSPFPDRTVKELLSLSAKFSSEPIGAIRARNHAELLEILLKLGYCPPLPEDWNTRVDEIEESASKDQRIRLFLEVLKADGIERFDPLVYLDHILEGRVVFPTEVDMLLEVRARLVEKLAELRFSIALDEQEAEAYLALCGAKRD